MELIWYSHLIWVFVAGMLGFLITVIFSRCLRLTRSWFLFPYLIVAGSYSFFYFRWSQVDLWRLLQHQWGWGVVGALVLGCFVVRNVFSRPASNTAEGMHLALALIWWGAVYGCMDAVFLSVMPVLATWTAFSRLGWTVTLLGTGVTGLICLVSSLFVTAAYHLGFIEYQGMEIIPPLFGNGMMGLGYLITSNPISAIGSHIAMHVAAVLHGPETALQLPPHYE